MSRRRLIFKERMKPKNHRFFQAFTPKTRNIAASAAIFLSDEDE